MAKNTKRNINRKKTSVKNRKKTIDVVSQFSMCLYMCACLLSTRLNAHTNSVLIVLPVTAQVTH